MRCRLCKQPAAQDDSRICPECNLKIAEGAVGIVSPDGRAYMLNAEFAQKHGIKPGIIEATNEWMDENQPKGVEPLSGKIAPVLVAILQLLGLGLMMGAFIFAATVV